MRITGLEPFDVLVASKHPLRLLMRPTWEGSPSSDLSAPVAEIKVSVRTTANQSQSMPQRNYSPIACSDRIRPALGAGGIMSEAATLSAYCPTWMWTADKAALNTRWISAPVFSVRTSAAASSSNRQTHTLSLLAVIGKTREVSG